VVASRKGSGGHQLNHGTRVDADVAFLARIE